MERRSPNRFDSAREGFGILPTRWYAASLVHAFLDRLVSPQGGTDIDELTQAASIAIMNQVRERLTASPKFNTLVVALRQERRLQNYHRFVRGYSEKTGITV